MNSLKYKNFLLLIVFIILHQLTHAQTIFVSGHISKDTTWLADTVKIAGNITIDSGKTLTINKGTYVQAQDYYKFIINGCIKAIGTQTDSIVFTVKDTTGYSIHNKTDGSWGGFCFSNTPLINDTSSFEYCRVQYCKKTTERGGAFSINSFSKIKIWHCLIINNSCLKNGGSLFCNESNPIVMYNTFKNNYSGAHGGAVCYTTDKIPNTNFSDNILIYNYAYL
jgi:hypothetical protein